jgi:hypothetical protein
MEAASGPSSRENEGGHKRFSMPGGSDRSMPVHSTECSFGLDVPRSKSLAFQTWPAPLDTPRILERRSSRQSCDQGRKSANIHDGSGGIRESRIRHHQHATAVVANSQRRPTRPEFDVIDAR